jgi:hypothetical protein
MFTAILRCGTALAYEVRSFLPAVGERVPCRHHGYCVVQTRPSSGGPSDAAQSFRRAQGRSQQELMDFLQWRPITTVHVLRQQRFTLRIVAAAEKAGLLDVDIFTGRVALRPAPRPPEAGQTGNTARRGAEGEGGGNGGDR